MALKENVGGCISLPASADLSTKQFYLVKLNSSGQIAVCGAGELAIGVLYTEPNAAGVVASVQTLTGRKTKGIAGGVIAAGDVLKSDANGKLVVASKAVVNTSDAGGASDPVIGSNAVGIALEAGVDGQIIAFLAYPLGAVPTTAA